MNFSCFISSPGYILFLEFCEPDLYILFYNYKGLQSIVPSACSICEPISRSVSFLSKETFASEKRLSVFIQGKTKLGCELCLSVTSLETKHVKFNYTNVKQPKEENKEDDDEEKSGKDIQALHTL